MSRSRYFFPATVGVVSAMLIVAAPARYLAADIFKLANGGQLRGVWLDSQQRPVRQYSIRLCTGGTIVLAPTAVQKVIPEEALEDQYQLVVAEHGTDVAGHWAIAQWCREHGLKQQRTYHLRCILRLAPDHALARRALGYTFVRGRWVTQDEFMREQGYVRYRGHWELPQEAELLEERRNRRAAELQWFKQLSLRRDGLVEDGDSEDYEAIAGVRDPLATAALMRLLQRETLRPVRLLYVRTLAAINTSTAQQVLLHVVLTDGDAEVVHACLDALAEAQSAAIHRQLMETLRDKDNQLVNRAAVALRRLGNEETVGPLIDALVTTHPVKSTSDSAQTPVVVLCNPEVLSTLVELTGTVGYGYDEKAWKQWHFLEARQAHAANAKIIAVRRDKSQTQHP